MKTVNQLLDIAYTIPLQSRTLRQRKIIQRLEGYKHSSRFGGNTFVENDFEVESILRHREVEKRTPNPG